MSTGFNVAFHVPDIDECTTDGTLCGDGDCINSEGGFRCECPKGYVLSNDGKNCIDVREEFCFNFFSRGTCSSPRAKSVTRSQCCCTMGKAWGNACEQCPAEDSGKPLTFLPSFSLSFENVFHDSNRRVPENVPQWTRSWSRQRRSERMHGHARNL